MPSTAAPLESFARQRTVAQTRVLDAALALFTDHGVSGTSFQMIADALDVTKAAVYHQFKLKDDLVIAVAERELAVLETALQTAEADPDKIRARETLLAAVIDRAVTDRGLVGALQFDPVIVRLLANHKPFQGFLDRLYAALAGGDTAETQVSTAMLSGAVAVAVMHPNLSAMDTDTLRREIAKTARRMLNIPDPA